MKHQGKPHCVRALHDGFKYAGSPLSSWRVGRKHLGIESDVVQKPGLLGRVVQPITQAQSSQDSKWGGFEILPT